MPADTYSNIEYKMHDKTPAAQRRRLRQNKNKTIFKMNIGNQSKTVRPSSRGNQNFEAARCYKSRKNAVRRSSRSNQNFEAATGYKSRKNAVRHSSRSNQNFEAARFYKARKDKIGTVKATLTLGKTNPTWTPSKYKYHKARLTTKYKVSTNCKVIRKGRLPHRKKHTPYGPYNIPHMVLCTKQGPDNA